MAVRQKVYRIGSALAVTIPAQLAKAMGIEAGSPVEIRLDGDKIILEFPKP